MSGPVPRNYDESLRRSWKTYFHINDSGSHAGVRNHRKGHESQRWDGQGVNADSVLLCDHGQITALSLGYLIYTVETTFLPIEGCSEDQTRQ